MTPSTVRHYKDVTLASLSITILVTCMLLPVIVIAWICSKIYRR